MESVSIAKNAAVIIIIVLAIAAVQAHLINAFRSELPDEIASRQSEAGWCFLFQCEKISYPSVANITEPSMEVGFDVGPEDLKYGQVPAGGGGKRFMNVVNADNARAKVTLVTFGNISHLIQPKPSEFILGSGEQIEVVVQLKTETDTETGYYSGGVTLIRLSPKHELLDFLMGLV
jgi:hypothetical protein